MRGFDLEQLVGSEQSSGLRNTVTNNIYNIAIVSTITTSTAVAINIL